jgi:hypothetical protein
LTSGTSDHDFRPSIAAAGWKMLRAMQEHVPDLKADVRRASAVVRHAREPAWSGYLTRPMARWIPDAWRQESLTAIKGIHTVIFFSVFATVVLTVWDGVRDRPSRRTAIAGGVVLAESMLYVSNNQVCPLTPLAEELGADRGSVVDLFLPGAMARRIPLVAGSAAVLALVLNVRALLRRIGVRGTAGVRRGALDGR